jgi:hypothetical protein
MKTLLRLASLLAVLSLAAFAFAGDDARKEESKGCKEGQECCCKEGCRCDKCMAKKTEKDTKQSDEKPAEKK